MGYLAGLNLYSYVNNNPVSWVDPWGYLSKLWNPVAYATVKNKVTDVLTKALGRTDKTIPTIPGETMEKTIDILSTEFAKALTPEQSKIIQENLESNPEKVEEVIKDVIEEIKEKHSGWPWEEWEDLFEQGGNK